MTGVSVVLPRGRSLVPGRGGSLAAGEDEPSYRRPLVAAAVTIALAFGGLSSWLVLARLDSAAIAPGAVIVDSHRKTIQHLEGGIVRELVVREGDVVRAGETLVVLDPTQAEAVLAQARGQYLAALGRVARLRAEVKAEPLVFPPDLTGPGAPPAAAEVVHTQQRLFASRREAQAAQMGVRRQKIAETREAIVALEAQRTAADQRLAYARDELAGVQTLFRKGYERKPRLLELMGLVAELEGRRGELAAGIARSRQEIATTEAEMVALRDADLSDTTRELQDTEAVLADLAERVRAAEDVRARTRIIAPLDGRVVDMKVFTVGGVVGSGQPVLDIVPADDALLVECRVDPGDIDAVREGLPAHVRLSAYRQRRVPPIDGRVMSVSADRIVDPRTGEAYFTARVALSAESLALAPEVALSAGMPAEVFITTGERRAIDYILAPIVDGMWRAFREE